MEMSPRGFLRALVDALGGASLSGVERVMLWFSFIFRAQDSKGSTSDPILVRSPIVGIVISRPLTTERSQLQSSDSKAQSHNLP